MKINKSDTELLLLVIPKICAGIELDALLKRKMIELGQKLCFALEQSNMDREKNEGVDSPAE